MKRLQNIIKTYSDDKLKEIGYKMGYSSVIRGPIILKRFIKVDTLFNFLNTKKRFDYKYTNKEFIEHLIKAFENNKIIDSLKQEFKEVVIKQEEYLKVKNSILKRENKRIHLRIKQLAFKNLNEVLEIISKLIKNEKQGKKYFFYYDYQEFFFDKNGNLIKKNNSDIIVTSHHKTEIIKYNQFIYLDEKVDFRVILYKIRTYLKTKNIRYILIQKNTLRNYEKLYQHFKFKFNIGYFLKDFNDFLFFYKDNDNDIDNEYILNIYAIFNILKK